MSHGRSFEPSWRPHQDISLYSYDLTRQVLYELINCRWLAWLPLCLNKVKKIIDSYIKLHNMQTSSLNIDRGASIEKYG